MLNLIVVFICFFFTLRLRFINGQNIHYEPRWSSLDSRPIPSWYDEAKIGIFIHWGVYSVPSYASEWFWINWHNNRSDIVKFMEKNYRPGFSYQDFARDFTTEFYDPLEWAALFEKSGAEYVIITSKHHEGYALWPSKHSFSWNSVDVGPHRNLIGDLAKAIRSDTKLHFGLYYSLFEWFNPLYLNDKKNNFTTQAFVDNKVIPELTELVHLYKPEIIWTDGEWEAPDTYWKSKEFLAWLYNESPVKHTVAVNDRWGSNTLCKHGGYLTCSDRYNPHVLLKRKWENAFTVDSKSWGFRRNADIKDFLSTKQIIVNIAETVSCNGNVAINIGPTKDGMITPIFKERLLYLGKWLRINGDAIYKTKPWEVCQNDTITEGVWYTTKKYGDITDLFAIVLNWPVNGVVYLGCPFGLSLTKITMLGITEPISWSFGFGSLNVLFPDKLKAPTEWAWTIKISNISRIYNKNTVDII